MNRARHFPTVCLARPISPATTVLVLPSEQRRMIRDRRASAWAVVGRRFQPAGGSDEIRRRKGASPRNGRIVSVDMVRLHERFAGGYTGATYFRQCFHTLLTTWLTSSAGGHPTICSTGFATRESSTLVDRFPTCWPP